MNAPGATNLLLTDTAPGVAGICPDLPGFHFEVKAVERLNIHEAMAQAAGDAAEKIPVVAHKRNRGDWLVTMKARDWFKLLAKAQPERDAELYRAH